MFRDPTTGVLMAKGQMKWLINKGDVILSNEPIVEVGVISYNFKEKATKKGFLSLYSYEYDDRPDTFVTAQDG